jgi:drug/metabolite transporter (DMT)-like permease
MKQDNVAANTGAGIAAILFGVSVVAVRIAVRDVPPLTLALLRFGQGSFVLFIALAAFRRDLFRIDRRDLPYLGLLGVIFFAVFPFTFNLGMRYVDASHGALLLATMPLWTLILARFAARERLSARQVIGVLTSMVGVAFVMADRTAAVGAGTSNSLKGNVLLIATAICGATYNVLAKRMLSRYAGLTVTFYAMLIGTIFLAPAPFVEAAPRLSALGAETLVMVAFLGVFGAALSFSLWTSALRRLSPTQVAVYINLNPISATLLAAVMLHEHLSVNFILGFLAVATGVMIVNWTRSTNA